MTFDELLYGDGVSTYRGLLPGNERRPLPPSIMTRQRRRAAERAQAKATPGRKFERPGRRTPTTPAIRCERWI